MKYLLLTIGLTLSFSIFGKSSCTRVFPDLVELNTPGFGNEMAGEEEIKTGINYKEEREKILKEYDYLTLDGDYQEGDTSSLETFEPDHLWILFKKDFADKETKDFIKNQIEEIIVYGDGILRMIYIFSKDRCLITLPYHSTTTL